MSVPQVLGVSFFIASVVASVSAASCGSTECTPENHDLGDALRLTPRTLPGGPVTTTACSAPRLEVIASEADLRRLYDGLGPATGDGGADAGGYPVVDFSRERVIVREGRAGEGISWAVARGNAVVVGLLACATLDSSPSCVVQVIAVPALVERAESRSCEAVSCGGPR